MLLQQDGSVWKKKKPETKPPMDLAAAKRLIRPLAEVEREAVESAMILCAGNAREAAFRLGISRAGLKLKLNRILQAAGEPARDRRQMKSMTAAAGK